MASLFTSPPFLSLPAATATTRGNYYSPSSSNSQSPSNIPPPPKPPSPIHLTSKNSQSPSNSDAANQRTNKPSAADSTDWIASTLTRRFGIGAGLSWVAFLAVGVISEQIKTRFEISQQQASSRDVDKEEEVAMPNGIRYYEMRVGGGSSPRTGDLVVMNVKGSLEGSSGQVFINTYQNRAIALVLGSRPYGKGICEGIEYVLRNMKAGGKIRVLVPPNLGFGEEGADLGEGVQIPPSATLEYIVELDKVSIAPA